MPCCTQYDRHNATLPAYTRSVFGDRSAWRGPAGQARPSVWMVPFSSAITQRTLPSAGGIALSALKVTHAPRDSALADTR